MANPEHVDILKSGISGWNEWRLLHPGVVPDLSGANLKGIFSKDANLSRTNLTFAVLEAGQFTNGDFTVSHLTGAVLRSADLRGADLKGTLLRNADLTDADLRLARFSQGCNLQGATFNQACFGWTIFADVNIGLARGLESVVHNGPSSIGIDSFFRSCGKIPECFLRGCGPPDLFISYAASLSCNALDLYSVFISYSSTDEDCAMRLHADLQANGVRCWFAPEDLRIGDKIRTSIDEGIRIHDKLLLILSESSVASGWVEKEVETAMERELRENKLVLFPIQLDDAVMRVASGWAADVRRARHIGDFRNWKSHDAYTKAFERLLRDLKGKPKARTGKRAELIVSL